MASHASTPAGKRRAAARSQRASAPAKRAAPKGHASKPATRKPAKRAAAPARSRRRAHVPGKRGSASRRRAPARAAPKRGGARRFPRPSRRAVLVVVPLLVAGLAAAYFGWFRGSSLVAVRDVQVKGVTGPEAPRIEDALVSSARSMTTLNLDQAELDAAVKGFPTVVSLSADPDFPNGLVIEVKDRPPALVAEAKGEVIPVAADGTLLRGVELGDEREQLPTLPVDELPASGKLGGSELAQALILGATPEPLRPMVEGISIDPERGVEVTLKGDIPVRFGDGERAVAKWAAASAVLADPKLDTLTYLDVRVPERPAAGGAAPAASEEESAAVTPEPSVATETVP